MGISSNSLFHFTKQYDYLLDTLRNGFWPRYCIEPTWNGKDFAIPMVCFCDIPLSQIQNHIGRYGKYGIGVTKEYAKKNSITPVLYTEATSLLKRNYLDKMLSEVETAETSPTALEFSEMMIYYIKRVEGVERIKDKSGKTITKHVKFYNEREWRYVPSISSEIHWEIVGRTTTLSCKDLSEHTKKERLSLGPEDIQYLIVRSENKVYDLCKDIDRIFKIRSEKERNLLKTKILYVQQIKKDF